MISFVNESRFKQAGSRLPADYDLLQNSFQFLIVVLPMLLYNKNLSIGSIAFRKDSSFYDQTSLLTLNFSIDR